MKILQVVYGTIIILLSIYLIETGDMNGSPQDVVAYYMDHAENEPEGCS